MPPVEGSLSMRTAMKVKEALDIRRVKRHAEEEIMLAEEELSRLKNELPPIMAKLTNGCAVPGLDPLPSRFPPYYR